MGRRRSGQVRLVRADAARGLGAFYGLQGILFVLVAFLPHDPSLDVSEVLKTGAGAIGVAAVLMWVRQMPSWLIDGLLVLASQLIALLIHAGHGSNASLAFAGLIVWVVVYAVVFRPVLRAVAHVAISLATASVAWSGSGKPWPDFGLVMVTAVITGLVVRRLVDEVRDAGNTDPSTGFLTAQGLSVPGQKLLDRLLPGEQVAVIVLQVSGWQQIIRSLGHDAAEAVMTRVAANLVDGSSRRLTEARLSGDRLVALLSPQAMDDTRELASQRGASSEEPTDVALWMAQYGLERIRGPHEVAGVSLQVEAHVGVAMSGAVGRSLTDLLRAGEAALADAVEGDTAIALFDPSAAARVDAGQLNMLAELRRGIAEGQLRVHYQIQVGAHTRRTQAVEALVRWQHPTRGLLPPDAFLPLAETTDIIVDLTWAVLDEALGQCARWLRQGFEVPVSVNLSARLLSQPGLVDQVDTLLDRHRIPARLLMLEVTETALISRPQRAATMIAALREHGVRISLDDFGTGTTSLTLLADVTFDEIKVDRSFVAAALSDQRSASIVRAIVNLGRELGLSVVAEGVEDVETGRWLAEIGCHELQGFYYGRPRPAAELSDLPLAKQAASLAEIPLAGHPPVLPEQTERRRLAALHALNVLHKAPDTTLDDISALAAQLCGTPMAAITLIDSQKQWTKSAFGCELTETPRSDSFCAHALAHAGVLEIPDAQLDPRFAGNPIVVGKPFVRFYAGAPLTTSAGHVLGSLCVFDTQPRTLTRQQTAGLRTLAASVASKLESTTVSL